MGTVMGNCLLTLTIEMFSGTHFFTRIYQIVGFKNVPNIYSYNTSIKLSLKQNNLELEDIAHLREYLLSLHKVMGSVPQHYKIWAWCHTPVNPGLERWRQEDQKFNFILSFFI